MKKIQIQIIVVIVFILLFVLINHLFINLPSEASYVLYVLYLIGGMGIIYFLRSIYINRGKRTFVLQLLSFIFIGLGFMSFYVFRNIALVMAFTIVSLIFQILVIAERFRDK